MKVNVGDMVRLCQIPDEPSNPEREEGLVLSRDELSWGISLVVQTKPKMIGNYYYDDGLRECTEDQVEAVIHPKK